MYLQQFHRNYYCGGGYVIVVKRVFKFNCNRSRGCQAIVLGVYILANTINFHFLTVFPKVTEASS